jgi:hypothetical protein
LAGPLPKEVIQTSRFTQQSDSRHVKPSLVRVPRPLTVQDRLAKDTGIGEEAEQGQGRHAAKRELISGLIFPISPRTRIMHVVRGT